MRIVCIGDSLTYGYGVRRSVVWTAVASRILQDNLEKGVEILNKGINGDTTSGMLARFETDVLAENPKRVFIMGGSNDIFFSNSITQAKNNICAMVFRCLHERIDVMLGVPFPVFREGLTSQWSIYADRPEIPELNEQYRNWLLEFSTNFNIKLLDFGECIPGDVYSRKRLYLDGIHLNEQGHQRAAECFVGFMRSIMKKDLVK